MGASLVNAMQLDRRDVNVTKMDNVLVMITLKGFDVTDAKKIRLTEKRDVLIVLIAITWCKMLSMNIVPNWRHLKG